ncbi:MAG: recombination protein NinB [Desulfobulbaceae bacterium]|nr:recombination protein NinB [Desulfobulbaceae bacterium]
MNHSMKIYDETQRKRALQFVGDMPLNHEIIIREIKSTRSLEQNAKMWATLTDISEHVNWHGYKLTKEEWKDVFTAAIKRQKVVPGLDGGFVVIGSSTSKMSVKELADVIECATAFGVQHDVRFRDYTD